MPRSDRYRSISGSASDTRTNTPALALVQAIERDRLALAQLQLGAGDRVAVRVERRVAELRGDQLLELLGDHVLEHLGLGVHAIPGHLKRLRQEQLQQAVVADHLERDPRPSSVRRTPR